MWIYNNKFEDALASYWEMEEDLNARSLRSKRIDHVRRANRRVSIAEYVARLFRGRTQARRGASQPRVSA